MVVVVGDIEVDHALPLVVVLLHVGELQTAIAHAVVALDDLLATIDDACGVAAVAVDHGEVDDVSFLPAFGIEGTRADEHIEHVVDAVVVRLLQPGVGAVVLLAVLAQIDLAAAVVVEHLIDVVALALAGTLAVVERCHVERGIAEQGVAQDEHIVDFLIAARGERGAPRGFALIVALHGGHAGGAGFHPYELPVVIEVVGQVFARLEGGVAECALCRCGQRQAEAEK